MFLYHIWLKPCVLVPYMVKAMCSCTIYGEKACDLIPYMGKVMCSCNIYGKGCVFLNHIWEKLFVLVPYMGKITSCVLEPYMGKVMVDKFRFLLMQLSSVKILKVALSSTEFVILWSCGYCFGNVQLNSIPYQILVESHF